MEGRRDPIKKEWVLKSGERTPKNLYRVPGKGDQESRS